MRERAHDQAEELRLVGVHEDGAHLIVSAANGDMFRLPLDEALRRAVARPAPQRPVPSGTDGAGMSPRQIQAEIRAGATAEEVAASSGVPLARVQRFEGPVLAEREHMARRAQAVEVPGRLPAQDALRGPAAARPVTLGEMASYRLSLHGVSADAVAWDSWRRPDGQWTVVAQFALPEDAPSSIGEEPPAMWTFHPVHRTLANANRWAQQLSELEPLDGPAPRRRLAAVTDRPFDVEAPEARRRNEALDREAELLDMLRARRGQRLGVDENGDDALALLLTHGIPAAHPRTPGDGAEPDDEPVATGGRAHESTTHDGPAHESTAHDGAAHAGSEGAGRASAADGESGEEETDDDARSPLQRGGITSLLSRLNGRGHDDSGRLDLPPGVSTATTEMTLVPSPLTRREETRDEARDETHEDQGEERLAPAGRLDSPDASSAPGRPVRPAGTHAGDGARLEVPAGNDTQGSGSAGTGPTGNPPRPEAPKRAGTPRSEQRPEGGAEPPRRSSRPKRSSVPSWDEIVFGTKGD